MVTGNNKKTSQSILKDSNTKSDTNKIEHKMRCAVVR